MYCKRTIILSKSCARIFGLKKKSHYAWKRSDWPPAKRMVKDKKILTFVGKVVYRKKCKII